MAAVILCDFCSDPRPRWLYPCREFETVVTFGPHPTTRKAGAVAHTSTGGWCACDPCHDAVEAGRDALNARLYEIYSRSHPVARAAVWGMWLQFLAAREGSAIPLTPGVRDSVGRTAPRTRRRGEARIKRFVDWLKER